MGREQVYDGGSKWLLEHQGLAFASMAGFTDATKTKAVQPEAVQQRQLPDGLLEIKRSGQKELTLLLVEFCTFPESRTLEQLSDDIMVV